MMESGYHDENPYAQASEIALGPGIVQYAKPGEDAKAIQPTRPYGNFPDFVKYQLTMLGAAIGVPYEMLTMSFTASYSASRAALNMAILNFKRRRTEIVNAFCIPVWRAFMDEGVARGYIEAPGYFENPEKQRAYQSVTWQGPAYPIIDPIKDAQASEYLIKHGFSTRTAETAEKTGMDWRLNAAQIGEENEIMKESGWSDETTLWTTKAIESKNIEEPN
jgi:lambda family phage portal protein